MSIAAWNSTAAGALRSVSEQVDNLADRFRKIWERDVTLRDDDVREGRNLLADIDEIMPGLDAYAARLASICRPAQQREISDHLIAIRWNFHNSKATGEAYGRIMVERVEAKQPSFAALEWATREIIDGRKFMPVTAEVLEALDEAQRRVDLVRDIVATLPARRARLAQRVADQS
jgi:hypothetical protein